MIPPDIPPDLLHHYTCDHGLRGITADRMLIPNPHPWLAHSLVWLTDLDVPDRLGLGLTGVTISCDRTVHRVDVASTPDIQWWPRWARKARVPQLIRTMIESAGGALPAHWWVSSAPVPVADTVIRRLGDDQRART